MVARIIVGDVRDVLATLDAGSVQTCVTSPPYFQLRDYNVPGQIGMEPTIGEYIATMVDVFRGVRRVLRDDGTVWCNIGDGFAGARSVGGGTMAGFNDRYFGRETEGGKQAVMDANKPGRGETIGLAPKQLLLIPARLALALQEPYEVPTCVERDVDRAWLAAMFDGEGCIGIRRHSSQRRAVDQEYQDGYIVYTSLTNNDVPLIDRCIELTGYGRAAVKQRADTTDGRGIVSRFDSYGWRLDGNAAVDVIRAIYPYLIAKRTQAVLAYNLDLSNKRGRELRGNGRLPQAEQDKRVLLYDLIKRANQREHVDVPSWCEEPKPVIEPGWYVRSQIIWAKPNPMPESVQDRPTVAHEHIWLLTKQARYYYDADAIRTPAKPDTASRYEYAFTGNKHALDRAVSGSPEGIKESPMGANARTVWDIATSGFSEAHFATFPMEIPRRCILAGSSERGACPACGAPWKRVVEREPADMAARYERGEPTRHGVNGAAASSASGVGRFSGESRTVDWQPTCRCDAGDAVPCVVLDPFSGAGTTGVVALRHGRDYIGIELNESYAAMSERRIRGDAPLLNRVELSAA